MPTPSEQTQELMKGLGDFIENHYRSLELRAEKRYNVIRETGDLDIPNNHRNFLGYDDGKSFQLWDKKIND